MGRTAQQIIASLKKVPLPAPSAPPAGEVVNLGSLQADVANLRDTRVPALEIGSPRLIVGKDVNQPLGNGTFDLVQWEYTEEESHASMWDASQRSRLVAPEWGLYRCQSRVAVDAGGAGIRQLYTTLNGQATWLDVDQRSFATGMPMWARAGAS